LDRYDDAAPIRKYNFAAWSYVSRCGGDFHRNELRTRFFGLDGAAVITLRKFPSPVEERSTRYPALAAKRGNG
jgi:hypothetical protein